MLYDICRTLIRAYQWYVEHHGLAIECVCANLLTCDIPFWVPSRWSCSQ